MLKIVIAILSSLAIGVGGYLGYQEYVEAKQETKVEKKDVIKTKTEEVKEGNLDKSEVQTILQTNLDSIFGKLNELGDENNWGNANIADFEIVKPEIAPLVTPEFADKTLKTLVNDYYCECDYIFKPQFNYEVQFKFEQPEENKLVISALNSANEIENMGTAWVFEMIKVEDWKMNKWSSETLDGKDVQLTKEDAEKLLKSESETPEFIEEYESKEAAGKAYLFNIKSSNNERLVAISSKDTKLVTDYAVEKKDDNTKTNRVETIQVTNLYEEFYEKMNFGKTIDELITEFGQPISEKELSNDFTLEYSDAVYTISKVSNQTYKVEIIGEKASSYYKNFDEVIKAYNPDPVYAEYFDEKTNDANGFHLTLDDGYNKSHIFTSKNENGTPISSVTIQLLEFR
ncbi:hypothetical protein [Robertmurraya sp.]|jgi:hypothetical protein|uniref:hypothetical protein n=1 Tax=Robertmurraya sp. TaxID=2837525 RepID=UPI003704BE22